jgi:hypothetical protein
VKAGQRPTRRHAGERFGRLLLVALVPGARPPQWVCRCDCGQQVTVRAAYLARRAGSTHSCGCLRRERARVFSHRHGHATRRGPEYVSWMAAKRRCFQPGCAKWADYGGRGITMCARWKENFAAFLEDMGPRPPGTTLDRIDPNGHYEPGNTRWATAKEQRHNRRRQSR